MYFESLQKKFTNIQHLAEIYIFHGSPDVMICKGERPAFLLLPGNQIGERILEISMARIPSKDYTGIPDKVGELFASLHWMLVAYSIKYPSFNRGICIKGMLIDKALQSVIHCEVTAKLCDPSDAADVKIKLSQPCCGRLNAELLCYHIHKLLE